MAGRVLLLCLLVALTAGCGAAQHVASKPPETTAETTYEVTLEPAAPLPKVLPKQACFVGINSYDVMLFGFRLPQEDSCTRLAEELFPDVEQLPWSRDEYLDPNNVDECVLARERVRLVVVRGDADNEGPRFDRAYDLTERACLHLEHSGWKTIFQER